MKTTLYVNLFDHPHPERLAEILEAFHRNLQEPELDRIVALIDEQYQGRESVDDPKVVWETFDCSRFEYGRPTYRVFFDLVNKHTESPYDINIVANSDIVVSNDIALLKNLDLEGLCLALTRWDFVDGKADLVAWDNSQATWIFQGKIRPLGWVDFPMGAWASDNRLAWQLRHDDYVVLNPCKEIKTLHIHQSNIRNIAKHVGGNSANVRRITLAECRLHAKRKSLCGLIAFSLWGNDPKYCKGATQNAVLAKHLYPGWTIRFYHDDTVPESILRELRELNADLVKMEATIGSSGAFWRFLAADDPGFERWIIRDADSRLNYRERRAVDEWIDSEKPFHVMRDHPYHVKPIMGRGFGGTRGSILGMGEKCSAWYRQTQYGDDEEFLAKVIWPEIHDLALIHDIQPESPFGPVSPFPCAREFWRFVGETCHHDEHWIQAQRERLFWNS